MSEQVVDTAPAQQTDGRRDWWHRDHPVFSALTGFFTGMLFVTALPGAFAALLQVFFPDTMDRLFPLVGVALVLPVGLLASPRTRRFGLYMVIGMVLTALVVLGVAVLVAYVLVRRDG